MVVVLPLVMPLPHVRLRLSFVKALGVVCRRSCRLIRPVRHLLPQSGSGLSLNNAVFVVVAARVRRQSGAFPAVAVAAGALFCARHLRPPPTFAFAARTRQQGVAPRREQVQMDDEQCPRNTIGVGPDREPVV